MWRKLIGSCFLHDDLNIGDLKKQDVPPVARPMKIGKTNLPVAGPGG